MSASKKLLALRFQPIVYYDDFKLRDGYSKESLRPLLDALPEIVAVVEAAELLTPVASVATRQAGVNRTPVTKAEAALAALEEKLKP